MDGTTLKSRALVFALCAGAVAFTLALLAGVQWNLQGGTFAPAVILAIICGATSWASATRTVAGYAEALDDSIERLGQAARGDLISPTPSRVVTMLPELANSLDGLLTQVRTNLDNVHSLAMYDPVTSLPNRAHFRHEATRLLDEMTSDKLAALFFIDLDKFKAVNDSFGHAQGDHVLVNVAERLREIAAPIDRPSGFAREPLVGRLAGDEFTMLVTELGSRDEAERIGDAILDALSEPYQIAGQNIEVGASIGVALRPDQGNTLTELMRAADVAMYHAKDSGRAQCQLFTPSLAARLADNVRLENELKLAVERREFTFVFQPQICLTTGLSVGAEALMRWRHPTLGLQGPETFLSRAEETGLIHEISYWAVDELAATLGRWERSGVAVRLGANVSARLLARPDFFAQVRHSIILHKTSADLLELEIGESVIMQGSETTLSGIARLRELGATVAVDDFGTGYSNFQRLKDLPVDRVKIDRSLIAGLIGCAQTRAIVQALIGLVHGFGYDVIAQGVENKAQRTILQVAGCDHIQGYAVARPMDEPAMLEWLGEREARRFRA